MGMDLCEQVNSTALYRECGQLLEEIKHNTEAAQMYEKGELFDRAALLYIQALEFDAAGKLLSKIQTPKLFLQYGKAREGRGQFQEALEAYEKARDVGSVVRLLLNHLDRQAEAFELVGLTCFA